MLGFLRKVVVVVLFDCEETTCLVAAVRFISIDALTYNVRYHLF